MVIPDQFHHRLGNLEKMLKRKTSSPTVPVYDLAIDTRTLTLSVGRFNVEISPNSDYRIDCHYQNDGTTSTFTWYLGGSVILTRSYPSGLERFGHFNFGLLYISDASYPDDPRSYYYIRQLQIGSTQFGTDKLNDSLATSPSSNPPYSSISNPTYLGNHGFSNYNDGSLNWQKVTLFGQLTGVPQANAFTSGNFNLADGWLSFHFLVTQDFMDWLQEISNNYNAHFVIGELLGGSGTSMYYPSGQIGLNWSVTGNF